MNDSFEIYRDGGYVLGMEYGLPYVRIGGETYKLTCHPYEPCLYITDGGGRVTAVHNSFDPVSVLGSFRDGRTVTSITGREYDAKDFCEHPENWTFDTLLNYRGEYSQNENRETYCIEFGEYMILATRNKMTGTFAAYLYNEEGERADILKGNASALLR